MSDVLVQIRGVSKAFGGVHALAGVDLDLAASEIHALCGENGAGKSTLIRVLSGACQADRGQVLVRGRRLPLGSVRAAETAGIAVIHQEPVLFLHLTAAENIFVGREPRRLAGLCLDRRVMRHRSAALLDRLGERIDPRAPLGQLPLAQRQMVAIARALSRACRLLILDEPTASLSSRETETLFRILRQLRADGVSILYVSHRLEEVFALADRVTVLRDGQRIGTRPIAEVDRDELIRMMVGRTLGRLARRAPVTVSGVGPVVLAVERLSRSGAFRDISFRVHAGEVVGLAGLVGAGRSELARCIFGIDRPDDGTITVAGQVLAPGSVRAALQAGIALVPEDRHQAGLVLPMSIRANLTLALLRSLARGGLVSTRRERDLAERLLRDLNIVATGIDADAWTLSGGNQQKLLLAKWLATNPRVLLLDEPTRGVDVGAKQEVHRLILQLAQQGMAALTISSDLPEILALSDRVLVMREGRLTGEFSRRDATQEDVLALALPGGDRHAAAATATGDAPP